MRLSNETVEYLQGKKYLNALPVVFQYDAEDRRYRTQIDLLVEMVRGKRVIHVGCVDHNIETVRHKIKRGKWLHARLCESAERCHGVDVAEDGIRGVQEEFGFHDTSCADILSETFAGFVEDSRWDYLLIPEVLEHLENPAGFLRQIGQRYSNCFGKVIITVPNGLAWDNVASAKKGVELINSDHRFWFTPYTIAKAVVDAGLQVEKILMCRHGTISWGSFGRKLFYRRHPLLRNDILCVAKF